MGNFANKPMLLTCRIDKDGVNKNSLVDIIQLDADFSEKGAKIVSREIFNKCKEIEEESERVEAMVEELVKFPTFLGSGQYRGVEHQIIETDYEYIIAIATII